MLEFGFRSSVFFRFSVFGFRIYILLHDMFSLLTQTFKKPVRARRGKTSPARSI